MDRQSRFSYLCTQCGRCCHDQVITLSPYDVIRLARCAGISTGEAVARYTIRRGSLLKFRYDGKCAALDGTACTLHSGRPLACRLYPLGLEGYPRGYESYVALDPAPDSGGIYGEEGNVETFLGGQHIERHLKMNRRYASVLGRFRQRVADLIDFDITEPREFWRVAIREALAETNFDFNPVIQILFDPDSLGCSKQDDADLVENHISAIQQAIQAERDPGIVAAAAVLLAVSLGYSPGELMRGRLASLRCCTEAHEQP